MCKLIEVTWFIWKLSADQLIVLLDREQCSISYFLASLGAEGYLPFDRKIRLVCVESIRVSDLPVYRRNATSVTVWIQKMGEFVSRESGTKTEPRNWLMVSSIPFGLYQPEWTDYHKTWIIERLDRKLMSRGLISYRRLVVSCCEMALDGSIIVEVCDETMAKMWRKPVEM